MVAIHAPEPSARPVKLTRAEQIKQANRNRRLERYQCIVELHRQGHSLRSIARQLGVDRRTVRRFVHAGRFPERATPPSHRRVDSVIDKLQHRWDAGCHNAAQLTRELQADGSAVSYNMVRRCVADWRQPHQAHKDSGPKSVTPARRIRRPSSRRVAWMLMKPTDELKSDERMFREQLLADDPAWRDIETLSKAFIQLVHDRREADLDAWIELATAKDVANDLSRFARGLTTDLPAIRAALSLPWSNGQVEGQINRLKLVKRQMYGRANFDLLRSRFLHAG